MTFFIFLHRSSYVISQRRSNSVIKGLICSSSYGGRLPHILPVRSSFFESSPKGWEYPPPPTKYSLSEHIIRGWRMMGPECKLWIEEVREKFLMDRKQFQHGDTDVVFKFENEKSLDKWVLGSDKLNNEGNSECELTVNSNGKGLFHGTIDTSVIKDGRAKRAGFCSMRSQKLVRSFQRQNWFEWDPFTHLELRVRGDGRNYGVLLGMGHSFDVLWLDVYQYVMFTRGGPYWETIRIPFSKFYRTSKGRIQDEQEAVIKSMINSVGILCYGIPGPFRLEIDYIGVHVDLNPLEEFAYEMYRYPKYIVTN